MENQPQLSPRSVMKNLVGKRITKTELFMGEEVTISKLTVDQVTQVRDVYTKVSETEGDDQGFEVLRLIIRASVEGAQELTDEDFNQFPISELSSLSKAIMTFSGLGDIVEGKPA